MEDRFEEGFSSSTLKCRRGAPAWVITFADLMSLLMCFFVLLLSFSEMDVQKYKLIAGSMKMAFGVQREVKVEQIPKGTTIISPEFSAGKPTPTFLKELRQRTTDETKANLDFTDSYYKGKGKGEESEEGVENRNAVRIKEVLQQEIEQRLLDVESVADKTIIRIQEKGSFPSGSAKLTKPFGAVMQKISDVLATAVGRIVIAGHTDNLPIATERYRSNWELSAARSVTVLHHLLKFNRFDRRRFLIQGYGASAPLTSNRTAAGRAKNRRVEIIVEEGPHSGPFSNGTRTRGSY
jgi:chemotaxis protein MotB